MKTIKVTVEVELTGSTPDARKFAEWIETKWSGVQRGHEGDSRKAIVTILSEDRVG